MAHPFHDNQIEVVSKTLGEIGAGNIPIILVLNKMDLVAGLDDPAGWEAIKGRYREMGYTNAVFISATTRRNLDELRRVIFEAVKEKHMKIYPNYIPHGEYGN
jgi:GTP-binding protein HflX